MNHYHLQTNFFEMINEIVEFIENLNDVEIKILMKVLIEKLSDT